MRKLVVILLGCVAIVPPVMAQQVANVAAAPAKDDTQATQMVCIVTDQGQAIVLSKAPEGVPTYPVVQKRAPTFDPFKQKLSKFNDTADGKRCVREPVLVDLTEQEQKDFLKDQWNRWFGPAAALLLDQQNQIRKLQNLPPIDMDGLMAEVQKLPKK